jgi:rsbT co-antagonist protein RsbR
MIGVPLLRDGETIGVFALGHSDPGATFPDVAEPLMTAFAQLASLALDNAMKVELIEKQSRIIKELRAPIIHVWDQVITLPLIGVVDSQRAGEVMDSLLREVSTRGALFAILDLTGVDVVDTATAGHLVAMVRAVKLLGAEGIITGIRPPVAQTMVTQGLDISSVVTLGSLREALKFCMRRLRAHAE